MFYILLYVIINILNIASASNGDYSSYFQSCLYEHVSKNCTLAENLKIFNQHQPLYLKLLAWDCVDESKYECMWLTVDWFIKYNYNIPQFYGKWPFIRIFGIQEFISVFASLIHFLINGYMLKRVRKEISNDSQLKTLWIGFAYMNFITWFWSTVFHTRDFPFTEKMDYYCAFGLVLYQVNAFFIRFFTYNNKIKKKKKVLNYLVTFFCLTFFIYHVYYLHFIHFDYGYNMKVNIIFGLFNSLCWLTSSTYEYFYKNLKYSWRNILSIIIIMLSTVVFEVYDFTPIFWIADGHALWHLTTTLVPLFWYQYFIDDTNYHTRIDYLTHLD
jgi:hypothetical protein